MHPLRLAQSISLILSSSSSSSSFIKKPAIPCHNLLPKPKQAISNSLFVSNSANNDSIKLSARDIIANTVEKVQTANSTPLTPIQFLERAAIVYADSPAILYNDTARTWSQFHVRCLKLASSIVNMGISRGDVVSVVAPNVPAMCELHFAVPMAGAILNNLNLRLDAATISNLLQHSGAKLVFMDIESASVVNDAVSLFPLHLNRPILVLISDEDYESGVVELDYNNYFEYENMVEKGDPGFLWIRPDSEWDPITLNYTSGTTSSPKGVLHSHRGAFMISMNSLLDWSVPKQPVYLWTLPMFHVNGWSYAWGMAAVGGANVCLRRFNAPSIYEAIEKYKVTHMCGAPMVLNMLTNDSTRRKPLETPVHIMTSGAPPPAAVLHRAECQGFIVSHGYGLTETGGPVVSCVWKKEWNDLPAWERAKLKARQGVATIGFSEVDVVDPNSGESVARDGITMGEIVLRGGSVMLGYLKYVEGTLKCMKEDGWLYTGDVGVMHLDGYLEVKDRSKDIIICGGENLSSVEVEAALYSHPAVNEAAVVGRPDKYWGETACAFISLKKGVGEKPTKKEMREFCKARLPLYMVPRTVLFKKQLPMTSTGKVQKYLLRNMAKDLGKL